jgi:hypothetical protein
MQKVSLERNQYGGTCELEEEENANYDRYGQSKRRSTKDKKLRTIKSSIAEQSIKNVRIMEFG